MEDSSSTRSLPGAVERHHEASPEVLPGRVRRSHSYNPIPLKDRLYSTLCRFKYGEVPSAGRQTRLELMVVG